MKFSRHDVSLLLSLWIIVFIAGIGSYSYSTTGWSGEGFKIEVMKKQMGSPHWLTTCRWESYGDKQDPSSLPEASKNAPGVSIHFGKLLLAATLSGFVSFILSLWVAPLVSRGVWPKRRQFQICLAASALVTVPIGVFFGLDMLNGAIGAAAVLGLLPVMIVIVSLICQTYRAAVILTLWMTTLLMWSMMIVDNMTGNHMLSLTYAEQAGGSAIWFGSYSILACAVVWVASRFRSKTSHGKSVSNNELKATDKPAP